MAGNKITAMITLAGKTQLNHHVTCGNAVITKHRIAHIYSLPRHTVLFRVSIVSHE